MAIQALSEAARGAHFLFSHFALLPLVNRRHLQVWAKDGPDAARGVHRLHGDRALAIAGADVLIEGEHHVPAGGCVLVYKEASLLDLVLLNRYVYEHANASVEAEVFAKFPWSREAFSKAGIVVFQRGDRSAAERMLNAVTQRVAQGARVPGCQVGDGRRRSPEPRRPCWPLQAGWMPGCDPRRRARRSSRPVWQPSDDACGRPSTEARAWRATAVARLARTPGDFRSAIHPRPAW